MLTSDEKDRIWTWVFHEDNLFDSRLQIFLTAHALMLTAAGFALSKTEPSKPFLSIVAVFGIFLGFVWFFVQQKSKRTLHRLEHRLREDDKLFLQILPKGDRITLLKLTQTGLIAWVLPLSFLSGWLGFAIWMLTSEV